MERSPKPEKRPDHLEFTESPDGSWGLNENAESYAWKERRNVAPREASKLLEEINFNALTLADQVVELKALIDVLEREDFDNNIYIIEELSVVLSDLEERLNKKPHSLKPRLEYKVGTHE